MLDHFVINSKYFDGPVLVTGADGCIGGWVVALLLKADVPVVAFDLSQNKRRLKLLIDDENFTKLTWVTGDIANTESVAEAVKNNGVCSTGVGKAAFRSINWFSLVIYVKVIRET